MLHFYNCSRVYMGINLGSNFNEGPFKGMFRPAPAVQLNKNIKMYK